MRIEHDTLRRTNVLLWQVETSTYIWSVLTKYGKTAQKFSDEAVELVFKIYFGCLKSSAQHLYFNFSKRFNRRVYGTEHNVGYVYVYNIMFILHLLAQASCFSACYYFFQNALLDILEKVASECANVVRITYATP